ncbi:hypothetical protein GGTG_12958 [Gaeumannomyces tritici R3-111a-1]|uniref:Required for respiratory growth protein 9, mitochondrial n=1 Tax=Gaeumannomyces tritici (strain R3-111a-1) TaxID=644352 RepID=J3PHH8_GAET3|nr:hypothetical protein GGTG_12958 [Gaeumannomyces tritici R3-111a-1]EJT69339.1 hypothetical protein GGTG_12958 [Gaeumannomyces tritici R3-111a-1]
MACNCRTTALRLFVRGFAQLHITEPALAVPSLRQRVHLAPRPFSTSSCRGISSSAPYRAPHAVSPAEDPARPSPAREGSGVGRPSGGNEAADHSEATPSAAEDLTPEAADALFSDIMSMSSHQSAYKAHDHLSTPDPAEAHDYDVEDITGDEGRWDVGLNQHRQQEKKEKKERKKGAALNPFKERKMPPAQATPRKLEPWQVHKEAVAKKLNGERWNPRKRLSPDALEGIRALHAQFPETFTTAMLAKKFEVSPEMIRRILKSKWRPTPEEEEERERRWFNRGKTIWERNAALGMRVPRSWRNAGVKNQRKPKRNDEFGLRSPFR